MVLKGTTPIGAIYALNLLSAAGSAILFAGIFSVPVMGAGVGTALAVAGDTVNKLKWPIFTIALILGFAFIFNYSGMVVTLGNAFAATGVFFPFFAPFLGWLGVFMTGSDTSSNAFFSKLHVVTAQQIGVDPVVLVAANSSGGVCGKMISPPVYFCCHLRHGSGRQGGRYLPLYAETLPYPDRCGRHHGYAPGLVFKWIIPVYEKTAAAAPAVAKAAVKTAAPLTNGSEYLIGTFAVALLITVFSMLAGKMIQAQEGADKIHFH